MMDLRSRSITAPIIYPSTYSSQGRPSAGQPNLGAPNPTSQTDYGPPRRGVGLHDLGITAQTGESDGDSTLAQPLSQTAAPSNWPAHLPQNSNMSQHVPNIISSDYNPFASRQSNMASARKPSLYTTSSLPPASPALSCLESSRSSLSSVATSEPYSSHTDSYYNSFNSRVTAEDHSRWPSEPGSALTIRAPEDCAILSSSAPAYQSFSYEPFSFEPPGSLDWPKSDTRSESALTNDVQSQPTNEGGLPRPSPQRRVPSSATRTRTTRKMTTREDANFQCRVKGCGKLFSRSYNFKAHMETHDAGRVYPFPCPVPDCSKKFVRKTDLQRHHQSVHMKERNFRCEYCSRFFARKDTLRRHMEDGCAKRFDLNVSFGSPEQQSVGQHTGASVRLPYVPSTHTFSPPPPQAPVPFQQLNFGSRAGYGTVEPSQENFRGGEISGDQWYATR